MSPRSNKKAVSTQRTAVLEENFNALDDLRLTLPLAFTKYPIIEDIVKEHKNSKNVDHVEEADASGNMSHVEIVEIREAITEEAQTMLNRFKVSEVRDSRYLVIYCKPPYGLCIFVPLVE
ncbi:hypothetical protein EON65_56905 [archaeon]|nr:MAG: hypothetical protein EON65_56905 [archaeon]